MCSTPRHKRRTTKEPPCNAEEAMQRVSNDASKKPTESTSPIHGAAASGYEMPCYHPLPAWRDQGGNIQLSKESKDSTQLRLKCGTCLGCRLAHAQGWALRCHLELQQHDAAVFTTLTYDDRHVPPTLDKRHLQLFLKRLRKARGPDRAVRFFASGEYGERTQRPHYHAIIYGMAENMGDQIEHTWQQGHTRTTTLTPAAIAYTAGYTSKKSGWKRRTMVEQVDPDTGEVYTWQPPFIQMSRRPGIGGQARQFTQSWRLYAIHNGHKMPVPRFLHEAWKATATPEQLEELDNEIQNLALNRYTTTENLEAQEKITQARQAIAADSRKYG